MKESSYLLEKINQFEIGNNVWIGQNVTILPEVTIGDGAIIAAGSVVTKSVPDFAIVAGVPAKLLKYRFSDSQQKRIKDQAWWEKSISEIYEMKSDFFKDLKEDD